VRVRALSAFLDGAVYGVEAGPRPRRVLLLHGWMRHHADFLGVMERLERNGLGSVALDLPGFGITPPPPEPWSTADYAALVSRLVVQGEAGLARPVVVGHSFGGRVALRLAASASEPTGDGASVAGLVLCAVPAVRIAPRRKPSLRYRAIRVLARAGLLSGARLEAARARFGSADYRSASGVMRQVLVRTLAESYDDAIAAVAALGIPVELLFGRADREVPFEVGAVLADRIPHARLSLLEGMGHVLPIEVPDRIADAAARLALGRAAQ
jgi:pimeloyl-ACP methyl ester carboxylesterase